MVDKVWPRIVTDNHYGQAIVDAARPGAGLVVLEWDVAFDLEDQEAFAAEIVLFPELVITAPLKIYAASHGWAGRRLWGPRLLDHGTPRWIEEGEDWADYFPLGMTYLPPQLLDALRPIASEPEFDYPNTDEGVSRFSHRQGLKCRVLWTVRPKHLHW